METREIALTEAQAKIINDHSHPAANAKRAGDVVACKMTPRGSLYFELGTDENGVEHNVCIGSIE